MNYDQRVFDTAMQGTKVNPTGLPPVLSSLLAAQAAHESGNFTSNFFIKYNNAFGYSYSPNSIYQIGSGTLADNNAPIAVYKGIEDSTREIVDWIYRRVKEGKFPKDLSTIQTPAQYAALLKSAGYYTDTVSNYTNGLEKFFVRVLQEIKKPESGIFILFVAVVAFYFWKKKKFVRL